jgi:hypothetical protein
MIVDDLNTKKETEIKKIRTLEQFVRIFGKKWSYNDKRKDGRLRREGIYKMAATPEHQLTDEFGKLIYNILIERLGRKSVEGSYPGMQQEDGSCHSVDAQVCVKDTELFKTSVAIRDEIMSKYHILKPKVVTYRANCQVEVSVPEHFTQDQVEQIIQREVGDRVDLQEVVKVGPRAHRRRRNKERR